MSFVSEIRIDHAELVTMVEIVCLHMFFMLNLEDHGDIGPHG